MTSQASDVSLVTGFPSFPARSLIRRLLDGDPEERIYLLVRPKGLSEATAFVDQLEETARARLTPLVGSVADLDLGLSGADYRRLVAEVTAVHHLAAFRSVSGERGLAERVNVGGTKQLLELALECGSLRRFCHYSTALVAGGRTGVILEEELDAGQRFRDAYEETMFRAEQVVADAVRRLPITVFRPSTIVGDSRSGEIDRFDGPYSLITLIVTSTLDVQLPLPGRATAPLHLVPVDFVTEAARTLSRDPRAVGRTFHLTDPAPFSARSVYELVARHADRRPPRGTFPMALTRALRHAPGLGAAVRSPLAFLESLNHSVLYNCRNTLELLDGTGVRCPPLDRYVGVLVDYVRRVHAARRLRAEEEVFDPFD